LNTVGYFSRAIRGEEEERGYEDAIGGEGEQDRHARDRCSVRQMHGER
jgi:hypothetical protein